MPVIQYDHRAALAREVLKSERQRVRALVIIMAVLLVASVGTFLTPWLRATFPDIRLYTPIAVYTPFIVFELILLHPDGRGEVVVLGSALGGDERVSAVVPAGVWMGGRPRGHWSLLSTVTVPPFSDELFEIGHRDELVAAYPAWRTMIEVLTRQ